MKTIFTAVLRTLIIVIAIAVTANAQQKKQPSPQKQPKQDEVRETFAKWRAMNERHDAIIQDLVRSWALFAEALEKYTDATCGSEQSARCKFLEAETDRTQGDVKAKLAVTPITDLSPFVIVPKGVDVEQIKWDILRDIGEAYMRGLREAKK